MKCILASFFMVGALMGCDIEQSKVVEEVPYILDADTANSLLANASWEVEHQADGRTEITGIIYNNGSDVIESLEVDYKFISKDGITVDTEHESIYNIYPEEMVEVRFVTYQEFDRVAIKSGLSHKGWFTIYDGDVKDSIHDNIHINVSDLEYTSQYVEGIGYYVYYGGTISEFKSRMLNGGVEEMKLVFGMANMSKIHPEYEYTLVGEKKSIIFTYKNGIPVIDNLNR